MLVERIVAPNPGPMTLTGTNTYLVGDGAGNLAAIDPGPDDLPAHLEAILSRAHALGRITSVIVTHRHLDHLPAAIPLCRETGATLAGHPDLPGVQRPLADNSEPFRGLVALHTFGHTRDSVSLWHASESTLFTGDVVLGTGTAVLDDAPGALSDYMASLDRLLALQPRTIHPGHGPIVGDGVGKLIEYRDHRRQRVQQVLDALAARGPSTADELAAAIYTDVPAHLLPMAARNVRANLEMLATTGRAVGEAPDRWRLTQQRG
ncbi:MAG TPA: MBL fold metallo-hydrolase [Chloroflexota bacterium]|jgi:glyoxylase-like metal-dependent hydrolase (beta-lactamase superfamily II)